MRSVAGAVNGVAEGHLINASEKKVRSVLTAFRAKAFQQALQMRINAAEADFSLVDKATGKPLRDKGSSGMTCVNINGTSPEPASLSWEAGRD